MKLIKQTPSEVFDSMAPEASRDIRWIRTSTCMRRKSTSRLSKAPCQVSLHAEIIVFQLYAFQTSDVYSCKLLCGSRAVIATLGPCLRNREDWYWVQVNNKRSDQFLRQTRVIATIIDASGAQLRSRSSKKFSPHSRLPTPTTCSTPTSDHHNEHLLLS